MGSVVARVSQLAHQAPNAGGRLLLVFLLVAFLFGVYIIPFSAIFQQVSWLFTIVKFNVSN